MSEQAYPRYFAHDDNKVALVQIDELTTEEWSATGRPGEGDFDHRHKRTTWPDQQRLQEYLKDFRTSNVSEYWQFQFAHKSFDDHYHTRANYRKQQMYNEGRVQL